MRINKFLTFFAKKSLNKNTFFILILLLFSDSIALGQVRSKEASIKWGNTIQASRRGTLLDVVGHDNGGYYMLMQKKRKIYLERYDNKLNFKKIAELKLTDYRGYKRYTENIIQAGDKLFLFSSVQNRKAKKNILLVQTINKKTLLPNRKIQEIATINYERRWNSGSFQSYISPDSSKIAVYYQLPYERGEREQFGFYIFDQELNEISKRKVKMPYKDSDFLIEDWEVDNEGNFYVYGIKYDERKEARSKRSQGKPSYVYHVLGYFQDESEDMNYPVKTDNYFLKDMKLVVDYNGDIVCAGLYSEKTSYNVLGAYYLRIDGRKKRIKEKSFQEFSANFITQNMTPRQEKRTKKKASKKGKKPELYRYDLDHLILREDGGAVLVAEQYFVVERTYTDAQGNTRTTYIYHYNDLIVVNVSPKGEIDWVEKIRKTQITSNDGGFYSSYCLGYQDDKLYFIFGDHPENYKAGQRDRLRTYQRSSSKYLVSLVTVNLDGEQKKGVLYKLDSGEVYLRPKVCQQINNDQILLFGQKAKTHRFGIMTMK